MSWSDICQPGRHFELHVDQTPTAESAWIRLVKEELSRAGISDELRRTGVFTAVDLGPYPRSGWKIHVSTTTASAEQTLRSALAACISTNTSFKFVSTPHLLRYINGPSCSRRTAGKFITIYPITDNLDLIYSTLVDYLGPSDNRSHPQILTDFSTVSSAQVFVRFGEFQSVRLVGLTGQSIPSLGGTSGDSQGKVDSRTIVGSTTLPPQNAPKFVCPPSTEPSEFLTRFSEIKPLSYSAHGGIYRATMNMGGECVIKEARHGCENPVTGNLAADDLKREYNRLQWMMDHHISAPAPISFDSEADSSFLCMEYIDGPTVFRFSTSRNPLLLHGRTAGAEEWRFEYLPTALKNILPTVNSIKLLHEAGLLFGDLSPNNIIIKGNGGSSLVDVATVEAPGRPLASSNRTPGYFPPISSMRQTTHLEDDTYALAMLIGDLLLPGPQVFAAKIGRTPGESLRLRLRNIVRSNAPLQVMLDTVCDAMNPDGGISIDELGEAIERFLEAD